LSLHLGFDFAMPRQQFTVYENKISYISLQRGRFRAGSFMNPAQTPCFALWLESAYSALTVQIFEEVKYI
jgi:hypothetical protein